MSPRRVCPHCGEREMVKMGAGWFGWIWECLGCSWKVEKEEPQAHVVRGHQRGARRD